MALAAQLDEIRKAESAKEAAELETSAQADAKRFVEDSGWQISREA